MYIATAVCVLQQLSTIYLLLYTEYKITETCSSVEDHVGVRLHRSYDYEYVGFVCRFDCTCGRLTERNTRICYYSSMRFTAVVYDIPAGIVSSGPLVRKWVLRS